MNTGWATTSLAHHRRNLTGAMVASGNQDFKYIFGLTRSERNRNIGKSFMKPASLTAASNRIMLATTR